MKKVCTSDFDEESVFVGCRYFSKWTPEDDKQLLEVVRIVGLGNWRRGNVIE